MAEPSIPRKLVSNLAVFILALIGLAGASRVACAQARVYVSNNGDDTVSEIDTSTNTVVATIRVGSGPEGMAVTPDGTRLYVANDGGAVWVIDTSNNSVVTKVTVGGDPYAVAISPDGTRAYVTEDNGAAVSAINTSSNTVIAKISVPAVPSGVAITPDGRRAYVASDGKSASGTAPTVSVIDTSSNAVVATVGLAGLPWGIAVTPDGTRVYVANSVSTLTGGNAGVTVIDTSSNAVVANVTLGAGISWGLAITPDGTRAYVATGVLIGSGANNGVVSVIDTSSNTVIATVGVADPLGLAITPDGTRVYVANDSNFSGASSVSVIDTSSNTVVATVGVGGIPEWVAVKKGSGTPAAPVIMKVANAFGDAPLIAPNTWVEIKGSNLAPAGDSRIWLAPDFVNNQLPTQLDGVSATVNGKAAYVYFISLGQVNILTPPDPLPGSVQVQLTVGGVKSNVATVPAQPQSLSFFEFVSADGLHYVYGRHGSDNSLVGPPGLFPAAPNLTTPVKPGESIYVAGNGFGLTDVRVVSGALTQSGNLPTPFPVVKIGGIQASVSFAALIAVGTYQINLVVPPNVPDGDLPLTATYDTLSIQPNLLITVQH